MNQTLSASVPAVRANIQSMAGYTPGEQPRDDVFIKLNTNENPYPPSPRVFEAIQSALTGDRLRKYPDPSGTAFRQAASEVLGIDPDSILIGNGSDDLLTIVTRAFVPSDGRIVSLTPSYLLYRTLAEIQGANFQTVPFLPDWGLPDPWPVPNADLTFLANPNSPSGTTVSHAGLHRLVDQLSGPLILDEAYVDFATENGLALVARNKVLVTRSFSKSYALAGIRFGFAVGHPSLIRELTKVKDSYNCDVLSLAAATAAILDQEYLGQTLVKMRATRARMAQALSDLGFAVQPSQANFVWCRHTDWPLRRIYEMLKEKRILVRYMVYPPYGDGLRISVGSDPEIDRLLAELAPILGQVRKEM